MCSGATLDGTDLELTNAGVEELLNAKTTPHGRTIVLTLVDVQVDFHLDMLRNFMDQVMRTGIEPHLVPVCTVLAGCCTAWEAGIPIYFNHVAGAMHTNPVIAKWLLARHILLLGYIVFFVDWDVGFHRNPLQHVFTHMSQSMYDIQVLSDCRYEPKRHEQRGFQECTMDYGVAPNVCVSTGVWLAMARDTTLAVVNEVVERSLAGMWQKAFNQVVPFHLVDRTGMRVLLRFRILPPHLASNAEGISRTIQAGLIQQLSDVAIIHCGFERGAHGKQECLESAGMWDPVRFIPADVLVRPRVGAGVQ